MREIAACGALPETAMRDSMPVTIHGEFKIERF
jgi:hypothetical protein